MTAQKRDVMFKSGETFAAAWLFLPGQAHSEARVPAVAMAHRVGAVKEMYLEPFARRFAEAGVAALVFDYRGFGASGGEPRQRVSPSDQMEDYRNALTWLSLQPESTSYRSRRRIPASKLWSAKSLPWIFTGSFGEASDPINSQAFSN
jgi:hypothetical protein